MNFAQAQTRYTFEGRIGEGGFASIIKAHDNNLDMDVVFKAMKENAAGILDARKEVDILKKVSHDALPRVTDFPEIDGERYLVMEYIPGDSLSEYVAGRRMMNQTKLTGWAIALCSALKKLHSFSPPIIHADIKPDNIIIKAPDARPVLIDFNISGPAGSRSVVGYSKVYAAPEVLQAVRAGRLSGLPDTRSDLYSLGASLYFAAAGVPFHPGKPDWKILERKHYSPGMIQILKKALEPDPARRFSSASAMKEAFENCRLFDEKLKKAKEKTRHHQIAACAAIAAGAALYLSGLFLA